MPLRAGDHQGAEGLLITTFDGKTDPTMPHPADRTSDPQPTQPSPPTDQRFSRRASLCRLMLPAVGIALAGCMRSIRSASDAADDPFPPEPGAFIMRPDGTRAFRNHALRDQHGRTVRFQDDLIEGRVFAANFMYVHCKGICPNMTARLAEAHALLRPVMGRPVQFYSFSLAEDSPEDMLAYMRERGLADLAGWRFLSGTPEVIKDIRWAFGLYDRNEEIDSDLSQHTGMARFGNHRLDKWSACPILGPAASTARGVLSVLPPSERPALANIYLEEQTRPVRTIAGWKEPAGLHAVPRG